MAAIYPFTLSADRPQAPIADPIDLRWDDPFLSVVDEAISQVDPRIGREVRMLAQLGLVIEAERLLIEYLVLKHPSYEILASEQGYIDIFRRQNSLMRRVTSGLSEGSTLATLAACLAWVSLGS